MSLKIFTNAFKGNLTESIAINSDHVASVFEIPWVDDESGEETKATSIFGVTGTSWQVRDSYLEVIARLNERD
jgi:hypothetical protein